MSEPLNAEQIADLEQKISQLPTIKKHDDDIKEIIVDLEGLKEGQRTLNIKVDEMGKGLREEIKELGNNIINKFEEKEMGELKAEIRTLKKKEEKDEAEEKHAKERNEEKKWDLVKIVASVIIGGLGSYLAVRLFGGQ